MALFIMQNIDCLVLTRPLTVAAPSHSVNMSTYRTGGRLSVHILLVLDPNERMSHLYRFLFFTKSDPAHPQCLTLSQTQCESLDEYFTISLHRETRIQGKVMYKLHTNICQSVSSMNLHPNVLKFPSPLSGNAYFLIIHRKALKHPGRLNFLFLLSFKQ